MAPLCTDCTGKAWATGVCGVGASAAGEAGGAEAGVEVCATAELSKR